MRITFCLFTAIVKVKGGEETMAQALIQASQLRLVFELGTDENGKMKYKNKNFNNIKTSATAEQLLSVAQAVASLQIYPLAQVERTDKHLLTN
jgi:hypothetical protein